LQTPYNINKTTSNKNIAFIICGITSYWAEAIVILAKSWSQDGGGDIDLITGGSGSNYLNAWDNPLEMIPSNRIHIFSPKKRLGMLWPSTGMWRKLSQLNPSFLIIYEYSPYSLFGGVIWAIVNKKPIIVTTDVGMIFRKNHLGWFHILIHRLVNKISLGMISKTAEAHKLALAIGLPSIFAPHAVSAKRYHPEKIREKHPLKILQVGSLIPIKGTDLLIKAFSLVLKTRPDAHLTLIGNGDSDWIRRLVQHEGIKESVTIKNFLQPEELVREYADADVFTLASRSDTYGVVVHEAAASGLPLVISRHAGASSTLVRHGENGFVIDPINIPQYADYLLKAMDPTVNKSFGNTSISIAKEFTVEHLGSQVSSWLKQLTSKI
jgi:glycosyltransferase involved in cell wall biosynthesis